MRVRQLLSPIIPMREFVFVQKKFEPNLFGFYKFIFELSTARCRSPIDEHLWAIRQMDS